ncbi:hypothetical protein vseg_009495 [Gypsophila vaccaria]
MKSNHITTASSSSLSFWDFIHYFFFRPFFAAFFVLFILAFVWWVAWKTVLVHVPLVQEIFGLRKKPPKPPPPQRRFTQYYNSLNATAKPIPPQS